jgi:hypothetical protein
LPFQYRTSISCEVTPSASTYTHKTDTHRQRLHKMNKKTTHLVTFEALRNSRMSNAQQSPPQVSDAATFIESHCKTVSVASPPDDDQTCPLYTVRHKDMDEEDTDKTGSESPVRIDLAACHHIFGIRCLRELTSLGEPLSSRCSLCRTGSHQCTTTRIRNSRSGLCKYKRCRGMT